jgi:O-succinylbenzoate synthase
VQIDFAPWLNLKILAGMNDGKYEFLRVRREFRRPFVTGAGSFTEVERVLIKTEMNNEIGFGEVAPWPNFNTESISECVDLLKSFAGDLFKLNTYLKDLKGGFPCLRAALSSCRHWSEIKNFNIKTSWAGLVSEPTAENIERKVAEGFKTIKLKISPQTSFPDIQSLILAAPQNVIFRLDANGSLSLPETEPWINFALSSDRIEFIEQPLPVNHPGYNQLDTTKVALDESFISPDEFSWAGPVVVKPSLVGDWDVFLAWRKNHPNKVFYSSVFETAFGRQAALWLAHLDPAVSTVGFDTLNKFKDDGLDRHRSGPVVEGLSNFDWLELWRKFK